MVPGTRLSSQVFLSGPTIIDAVPRRLLLIRHGQSTWNAAGRWQGQADPPLSEFGAAQAAEAADQMNELGLTGVVCSDLNRAKTTAEIMADALSLSPPAMVPELREYDVGDWCGLTRPEIEARWPGVLAEWSSGRLASPPNGEPRDAFVARVRGAVERLLAARDNLGDHVLVVTHGGVIRALTRSLGGEPDPIPNVAGRWFEVADGELTIGGPVVLLDPDHRTASPSA
jgi:broad specificity phosphatase PhoE